MPTTRSLVLTAALVAAVAACSGGGAAASLTPPPDSDAAITARDSQFDEATVTVPAAVPFGLFFKNLDGVPHNVAIFTDRSASTSLFVGETITNAAESYDVPALEPGTYFFRCDVHPNMNGTIVAAG